MCKKYGNLGTGFLGAYTTFSTFNYDTLALLERGDFLPALWNVLLSVVCSIVATYIGMMLARLIG